MKLLIGYLFFTLVVIIFSIDSSSASGNQPRPKIPICRPGFPGHIPQTGSGSNRNNVQQPVRPGGTISHHQPRQPSAPRPRLDIDLNKPPPVDNDPDRFLDDFQGQGHMPPHHFPPPPNFHHQ